ncbi:rhodanese-like domain-containing protein [Prescottella agglutinans]|uniref:rhodanese-like domain-containing protein n=1 Tax=Prescottella agglutinans TaxID=1644129 RepID=UPI003D970D2F
MTTSTITRDELTEALNRGEVTLLDTLGPAYYAKMHIPGALNLVEDEVESLAPQLIPDRNAEIVTYCANVACRNSELVAGRLEALGYTNVRRYREGIADWEAAGLPVEGTAAATARH